MAVFNPHTEIGAGDYTGASGGQRADQSWGTLFEGVGNIVTGAAKALDDNNLYNIQGDLQAGVDKLDNKWLGLTPFPEAGSSVRGGPGGPHILPPELTAYKNRLNLVKQASQAGTLPDSQYQLSVDTLAREVRTRYPGYRDQIDTMLSSILGHDTANKAREQLMQEWAQESALTRSELKWQDQYIKEHEGQIPVQQMDRWINGDHSVFPEIRKFVSGVERIKTEKEARIADLALKDATGKAQEKDIGEALNAEAISKAEHTVLHAAAGQGIEDIEAAISKHDPKVPWSPEEVAAYQQSFGIMRQQLAASWQDTLAQPWDKSKGIAGGSYATRATAKQQEDAKALLFGRIDTLESFFSDKKFNVLAADANITQQMSDSRMRAALTGPDGPVLQLLTSLGKLGPAGSAALDDMLSNGAKVNPSDPKSPTLRDALQKAFSDMLSINVVAGANTTSMNGAVQEANRKTQSPENPNGLVDGQTVMSATRNAVHILVNPDAPPAMIEKAAVGLFGKDNADFLDSFKNVESQNAVFRTLVNPRVTQAIKKASESNPEIWENYKAWSLYAFQKMEKQDAENVMEGVSYSDYMKFTWDEKANKIQVEVDPNMLAKAGIAGGVLSPLVGPANMIYEAWRSAGIIESVNRFNDYAKSIAPILTNDGDDVAHTLSGLIQHMGVDLTQPNQGSLLSRIGHALTKEPVPVRSKGTGSVNPDTQTEQQLKKDQRSELRDQINRVAQERGADPLALATAIAYETKGTFSTEISGGDPNSTNGPFFGLIQFGANERRDFGVTPGMSVTQQMESVNQYLKTRGFKPGMDMLDLYSTILAGSPGRYTARDKNDSVVGHVLNRMDPFRKMAEKLMSEK